VGDEHFVDFGDAGVFHCGHDALGVATVVAGPAGVNEQGAATWGHEERGLPAFDVHCVDEKVIGLGMRPKRRHGEGHQA